MIKNFDDVKTQLSELSGIINSFKSEAVQLRIVELVFGKVIPEEAPSAAGEGEHESVKRPVRRRKKREPVAAADGAAKEPKKRRAAGGGAVATLRSVFDAGYFKTPRTIGDIVAHCDVDLARKIKPNEISGKLARMVQSKELKRERNSDGQYQYKNFAG